MKLVGFYNFGGGGGGSSLITGITNENLPSFTENVGYNEKVFFSGQFSNLSRQEIHITLQGFGTTTSFHRHDLRAYESFNVQNVPVSSISVYVPSGEQVGVHGMGTLVLAEDEDEYAICLAKAHFGESLPNSPQFNTSTYTRTTQAAAATFDLVVPATDKDVAVYKITMSPSGANNIDIFWTDSVNANVEFIGRYTFAAAGTFVVDFDPSYLRNPNRQNGKLRATTSTAASTIFDIISNSVGSGQ